MIKWSTKKIHSLFKLKSKNPHLACNIYFGECSCGETYVGETSRNVKTRWDEHDSADGKSEPARHLEANSNHQFTWKILLSAPLHFYERKNLEAFQIGILKPSLNKKDDTKSLHLFRNGVT